MEKSAQQDGVKDARVIDTPPTEAVKGLTSTREFEKPIKKTTKATKKKAEIAPAQAPKNLEEFVLSLASKPNKIPEMTSLSIYDLDIATELKNIFTNTDYKPNKTIKFETINSINLKKLVKVSVNTHFVLSVFINFQSTSAGDLALNRILSEYKKYPDFTNFLDENSKKNSFQDSLMRIAEVLKTNIEEYRNLRWWLISNIDEENLHKFAKTAGWKTLKGKSDEFLSLSGLQISQLLRKLSKDSILLMEFLVHIEVDRASKSKIVPLQKILTGVTPDAIAAYILEERKGMSRSFIESLFLESLQNKLDSTRTLEGCLPFYLIESKYPHIFSGDRINRSWKRAQISDVGLIEKFQNDEVNRLTNDLEEKIDEIEEKTLALEEASTRLKAAQGELEKNRKALQILEDRLRERVSDQSTGNNAIERQIRINQIRVIVEIIEPEMSSAPNSRILAALEKIGIRRIGSPGENIDWDSLVCESITGVEIVNPVVIKPGYTWSNNGDTSVLLKALVKPRG